MGIGELEDQIRSLASVLECEINEEDGAYQVVVSIDRDQRVLANLEVEMQAKEILEANLPAKRVEIGVRYMVPLTLERAIGEFFGPAPFVLGTHVEENPERIDIYLAVVDGTPIENMNDAVQQLSTAITFPKETKIFMQKFQPVAEEETPQGNGESGVANPAEEGPKLRVVRPLDDSKA